MAAADVYELAYRESVRTLEHQLAALSELRGRASMLLAAASITISLLGQETFQGMRSAAWAAVICFALLSICVLAIVWPHVELSFEADPHALLVEQLSSTRPTLPDLSLELIAHMARHRQANARRLSHTIRVFRTGVFLLAIQIVLTIVAGSVIV